MTNQFDELPDHILAKVISYLPQQAKINLLYTNYKFYSLVQPLLYKKLVFAKTSLLNSNETVQNSEFTMVGYALNPLVKPTANKLIYTTRQEVLAQSFTFNPDLLQFVEEVLIYGVGDEDTEAIIPELLQIIKSGCVNLKKFEALNTTSSIRLTLDEYKKLPKLERFDIFDLNHLNYLHPATKTLAVHTLENTKLESGSDKEKLLEKLYNISYITFNNESATIGFLDLLLNDLKPSKKFHLRSLKVFHYHGFNDYNIISRTLFGFKTIKLE
ncbi:unnamed protein product [Ambrosiozyma monospora]|uniref:Unnamed protein product n=1 Tax=Ambrosiozyma monospora TaxID=43982 RepID=A0ACB5T8C5_AMBMO|nr:unnamed protein product [Ambrosiozyma monospora]